MSSPTSGAPRYHFSQPDHWRAGLLRGASFLDAGAESDSGAWTLLAPLQAVDAWPGQACTALAVGREGTARWATGLDQAGYLEPDDREPQILPAPRAYGQATWLVAGRTQGWSSDGSACLHAWTRRGPVLRFSADLPLRQVNALWGDGQDGLWVLGRRAPATVDEGAGPPALLQVDAYGRWRLLGDAHAQVQAHAHVHAHYPTGISLGSTTAPAALPAGCALASVQVGATTELVLLSEDGLSLIWLEPQSGQTLRCLDLAHIAPGLRGLGLSGDGRDRLFLAASVIATDGDDAAGTAASCELLMLDAQGEPLTRHSLPGRFQSLAFGGGWLLLATQAQLQRFRLSHTDADSDQPGQASFVSPVLTSPPAGGLPPWLRADLLASLPIGSQASLRWIATNSEADAQAWRAILADASRPPVLRLAALEAAAGQAWSAPLDLVGEDTTAGNLGSVVNGSNGPRRHALPLHQVPQRHLCLRLDLHCAPATPRPVVRGLDIVYPDLSLMQYLPATYRRQAEVPGDLMRRLVGLLDASVDQFDQRIARLGELLDPLRTEPAWLDALAAWLGLPWDVTLPEALKRRLLAHSADLLVWRGTRRGLELMLACLLPPGRLLRLFDPTAEGALGRLPCAGEAGPALPLLLGGLLPRTSALGRKAVLGLGRLPRRGIDPADPSAPPSLPHLQLTGYLEVQLRASAAERQAWSPWLGTLLREMVPLNARLSLRWLGTASPSDLPVLDEDLRLGPAAKPARLGRSPLGQARLPRLDGPTLDATGPTPGIAL